MNIIMALTKKPNFIGDGNQNQFISLSVHFISVRYISQNNQTQRSSFPFANTFFLLFFPMCSGAVKVTTAVLLKKLSRLIFFHT